MTNQWKITDEELENLLREAYAEEPETCERGLSEEPIAFVEKTLSSSAREEFKTHLAECNYCVSEVVRLYRAMQYMTEHETSIMTEIAKRIRPVQDPAVTATPATTATEAARQWVLDRLETATGRYRVLKEKLRVIGSTGVGGPAAEGVFAEDEPTKAEFTSEDRSWLWTVRETEDGATIISVETTRSKLAGTLARFALIQMQRDPDRELAGGFMVLHPAFDEGECVARYRIPSCLEPVSHSFWRLKIRPISPQDLSPADIPTLKTSIANAADLPSRRAWCDLIRSLPGVSEPVNAEVLQALISSSPSIEP